VSSCELGQCVRRRGLKAKSWRRGRKLQFSDSRLQISDGGDYGCSKFQSAPKFPQWPKWGGNWQTPASRTLWSVQSVQAIGYHARDQHIGLRAARHGISRGYANIYSIGSPLAPAVYVCCSAWHHAETPDMHSVIQCYKPHRRPTAQHYRGYPDRVLHMFTSTQPPTLSGTENE